MINYLDKFRLDNKIAYIVGGLGLIGREVSSAFSQAGAKTILLDLIKEHEVDCRDNKYKMEYDTLIDHFDCSDMDMIEEKFESILEQYHIPDIFINCSYPRTNDWADNTFNDVTIESFRKNVDIHMNSFVWLARQVAEAMAMRKNGGSIIQISSIYGMVGQDLNVYEGTDMKENMSYAAIKGGVISFTKQMASYYGQHKIRVNTICPGGIEGPVAGKNLVQNPIFVKQYSKRTPLKRLGKSEEIASTALYLASDAASYVSGATIAVDGGWTSV